MSRSQQKTESRQRLVDAANYLFARKGLASTRTVDIARRAGLSHGGMFVHFASRNELLAEIVGSMGRQITDQLHQLISEDASLEQVLEAHLQCLAELEATYATFLRESRLLPKDVLRSWVGVQSAISVHMEQCVRTSIESGCVRRMPQHLLFNTWIGLVHHYLMNRELFAPGESVFARRGKELIDHFLSLVCVENDSE